MCVACGCIIIKTQQYEKQKMQHDCTKTKIIGFGFGFVMHGECGYFFVCVYFCFDIC